MRDLELSFSCETFFIKEIQVNELEDFKLNELEQRLTLNSILSILRDNKLNKSSQICFNIKKSKTIFSLHIVLLVQ